MVKGPKKRLAASDLPSVGLLSVKVPFSFFFFPGILLIAVKLNRRRQRTREAINEGGEIITNLQKE
jgi:hypothetical protein